jgi:twitching motility protein PilU
MDADLTEPRQTMHKLLALMVEKRASDLFITVGYPPALKIDGKVVPVSRTQLDATMSSQMVRALMSENQATEFRKAKESNFAIAPEGIGRFRVCAFVQQGHPAAVLRTINTEVPTLSRLDLPPILKDIIMAKRGLVVMVGGTGTGKTTTLAAMLNHRNEESQGHIVTIEDPIEYIHPHKNCVVTQREVGVDTDTWEVALQNALRQAPDVILMGEIRSRETMEHAISFAETGHLCVCTLHANSADQALDRIVNFFPQERHAQLFMDLSLNLRAMVSQRLIPIKGQKGRVPAIEILLNSPLIQDLIFKGAVKEIKEVMKKSRDLGMQTFDQCMFDLHEKGLISYEDALRNADSVNDLRLNIKLHSKLGASADGTERLSII